MKLPNNEEAYIAESKITKYLLSEIHEDGKYKAAFFRLFGFSMENCKPLLEERRLSVLFGQ
jgi:hypothetical protein